VKSFILGIVVMLVALAAVGYVYASFGFIDMRADQTPPGLETKFAGAAMDSLVGIALVVFLVLVGAIVFVVVRCVRSAHTDRRAMAPSGSADLKLEPK